MSIVAASQKSNTVSGGHTLRRDQGRATSSTGIIDPASTTEESRENMERQVCSDVAAMVRGIGGRPEVKSSKERKNKRKACSANKNHKTGENPHHQKDGADRSATMSTGEISGGRIAPFLTPAADVRETISQTMCSLYSSASVL